MRIQTDGSLERDGQNKPGLNQDIFQKSLLTNQNQRLPLLQRKKEKKLSNIGASVTLDPLDAEIARHSRSKITAPDSMIELLDASILKKNDSISIGVSLMTEKQKAQQLGPVTSIPRHVESQRELGQVSEARYRSNFIKYRNSTTTEKPRVLMQQEQQAQRFMAANQSQLMEPISQQYGKIDFNNFVALQSAKHLPIHRQETSVNVLPVIGSEIDYSSAVSGIKSKVDMTRKDIQQFLVNGSISKQFIASNKKELQKFIKKEGRASSDFFRGYQTYDHGGNKTGRDTRKTSKKSLDTIMSSQRDLNQGRTVTSGQKLFEPSISKDLSLARIERKQIGPATVHYDTSPKQTMKGQKQTLSQKAGNDEYFFPDDVKIEKNIESTTPNISTRALETWLNETLTDAYHLEIPGIVVEPGKKKPIFSFGIDPHTLASAGVSKQDITRIYRALFVYSVGFFEFLKKILSSSSKNYGLITSIWKVYQVLLEYCCKTGYRILLAEMTDKHHEEMTNVTFAHKEKIGAYKNDLLIMRQNLESQQHQCDEFEKDRDQEKQLRLKLEEEYMTHQQNHEEEVKLRLKFEGKFNVMHDEHRELQIQFDRKLREIAAAQNTIRDQENELSDKSKELIQVKQQNVEYEAQIVTLKEYKKMAAKDIHKKGNTLMVAEQQRLQALDDWQLERYCVQERLKDTNDIKAKMEIMHSRMQDLEGALAAAKIERKVFEDDRDLYQEKYEMISKKFEARQGVIDVVSTELEATKKSASEYFRELTILRSQLVTTTKQLKQITEVNAVTKAKDQTLEVDNIELFTEVKTNQNQLQEMNKDRHALLEQLQIAGANEKEMENQRDSSLLAIDKFKDQIAKVEANFADYQRKTLTEKDKLENSIITLKERNEVMKADIMFKAGTMMSIEMESKVKAEMLDQKQMDISQLEETVHSQTARVTMLNAQLLKSDNELQRLYSEVREAKMARTISEDQRLEAELKQTNAEQVCDTMQRTIVTLRKQLVEERSQMDAKLEMYFITIKVQQEREAMACEEYISRYGQMKEDYESAELLRTINLQKLNHYDSIFVEFKQLEKDKKEANAMVVSLNQQIETKDKEIKDRGDTIDGLIEKSKTDLFNLTAEHKIEVNEIEQKITDAKLKAQTDKNAMLKEKRDQAAKVKELQKQLKESVKMSQGSKRGSVVGSNSPSKVKSAGPEEAEKETQTTMNGPRVRKLLGDEKLLVVVQQQLDKYRKKLKEAQQSRMELIEKYGSKSSIALCSESDQKGAQLSGMSSKGKEKEAQRRDTLAADYRAGMTDEYEHSNTGSEILVSNVDENEGADPMNIQENQTQGLKAPSQGNTTDRFKNITTAQDTAELESQATKNRNKQQELIDLIIEADQKVLQKIEEALGRGEAVSLAQIKKWRGEIRIPIMLQKVELTQEQKDNLAELQNKQTQIFEKRAIRKLEEGSQYSSDNMEVEQSEYLTSDGEGDEDKNIVIQESTAQNMLVLRGPTLRPNKFVDDIENVGSSPLGKMDRMSQSQSPTGDLLGQAQQVTRFTTAGDASQTVTAGTNPMQSILTSLDDQATVLSAGATPKTAIERMELLIKKKSDIMKAKEERMNQEQDINILLEEETVIPVVSYVIMKKNGVDVRKRRSIVKNKIPKERDVLYAELRARIRSARAKRRTGMENNKIKRFSNMFGKFAENYENTLDLLMVQSRRHLFNKAQDRQKIRENKEPAHIEGRDSQHKLIAQVERSPSLTKHSNALEEELKEQAYKWENREEIKLEEERKNQQQRELEAEMEVINTQKRKELIQIVHEDKQKEQPAVSAKQQQPIDPSVYKLGNSEVIDDALVEDIVLEAWSPQVENNESEEVLDLKDKANPQMFNAEVLEEQQQPMGMDDELSVWSGGTLAVAIGDRKSVFGKSKNSNQHGEDDLILNNHTQLQQLMEESKAQRQHQGILDNELATITKGGVSAVTRQSVLARVKMEHDVQERQAQNENRARKRDMILAQNGMLAARREEDDSPTRDNSPPRKLGPSTIRTIIRAAESRPEADMSINKEMDN